jgi:uncharacterized membrane protein
VGIDSFGYKVVLAVHILSAIVGLGGVALNGIYAVDASKRRGEAALAVLQANFKVTMVAEKFIYVVPLTGIAMVLMSDGAWSFSDTWVWLALVLFVAALGVSHGILIPSSRATLREVRLSLEQKRAPDTVLLERLGRKGATAGPVLHLLLVVLVIIMIWKPGA